MTVDGNFDMSLGIVVESDTTYCIATTTLYLDNYAASYLDDIRYIRFHLDFPENYGGAGPGPYIWGGEQLTAFSEDADFQGTIYDDDPGSSYNYMMVAVLDFGPNGPNVDGPSNHIPVLKMEWILTGPQYCSNGLFDLWGCDVEDLDQQIGVPGKVQDATNGGCGCSPL